MDTFRFGVVIPQHRREWAEIREQALWAERSGWDSVWLFDHLLSLGDDGKGSCLETWTSLAALAEVTTTIRIGSYVSPMTFHLPGVLAKQAITVDQVSEGRLILGAGLGWHRREHQALGVAFPRVGQRRRKLHDFVVGLRQLESEIDGANFSGSTWRLNGARFRPKPTRGHIPILIGSNGPRSLPYVARYADYWGTGGDPRRLAELGDSLQDICAKIGRPASEITWVVDSMSTGFGRALESPRELRDHVLGYGRLGARLFLMYLHPGMTVGALDGIIQAAKSEIE